MLTAMGGRIADSVSSTGAAAARGGARERPEGVRSRESAGRTDARLSRRRPGRQGDYAGAGRTLERALGLRRKLLGEHGDVAVTLVELGRVYQDQGLNQRAEPLHREALDIRRKVLGNEHRETAVSLSDLASVLRLNGDIDGAEPLLKQSLELNIKTRGADHPNTAVSLHDLGLIAASRGDYLGAESGFRQALGLQRKALGTTTR